MFHAILLAAALDVPTDSPVPSPTPSPVAQTAVQASPAPQPKRRALPAPLDPIFPSAEFNGPTIGVPTDPGIRVYGWVDAGIDENTSNMTTYPMSYNVIPNRPQLDQAVLRIERQPDTTQTDHVDWGFRLSNIYGADYRFTTSEGWWSNQLLKRNQVNGYDLPEAYGILYLPKIGRGTTIQLGRYISPPDIEAQLAPNNFLYSHSLMFTFDAYTQTGVLFSTKINDKWTVMYGVHAGNDTAPWDGSAHTTFEAFGRYVSPSNRNSVLFGVDALNNGQFKTFQAACPAWVGMPTCTYGHDNVQQSNVTWTHVFNSGFQNQFEAYYIYQFNAYAAGTIGWGPPAFGGGGGPGAFLPGRSTSVGAVDYLEYKLSPRDFASFRMDYLNDPSGQRTGYATSYGSLTLGVTHHVNPTLEIRPEVRIEKAFAKNVLPYNSPNNRAYQSSFGVDAMQFFGNP